MSFTVYPTAFTVSRPRQVTAKGTGTSWTSATTFTVNGGASLSGVTIDVAGQVAKFTLLPAGVGTLTISNTTDASTATVTVATTITVSGSHLIALDSNNVYDATSPIPPDILGRTIVIAASGDFVGGKYVCAVYQSSSGGLAFLQPVGGSPALVAGQANGAWSYKMGPGGNGLSGGNLYVWSGDNFYVFDPDSNLSSALNGAIIRVSNNSGGITPGDYSVTSIAASYISGDQGGINLARLNVPAGSNTTGGGAWMQSGGETIPIVMPNSAFAGPIKLLLIGDSITAGDGTFGNAVTAAYPNASSIAIVNRGVSGTRTIEWLPGDGSGNLAGAISAANAAGSTVISIMLGTNDAKVTPIAPATHKANMQSIINALLAGVPTLRAIVLQEQPYVVPGTGGWSSDSASNDALQAYFTSYATITGATQGISNSNTAFAFMSRNPQLLGDGVHPTPSGNDELNYSWLTGLAASIVSAATPPAPVLTTLPLTPSTASVVAGGSQTFTASGLDQFGASIATGTITWTTTTGTISSGGVLTAGTTLGTTFKVRATGSGGVYGEATVTVTAAVATSPSVASQTSTTATLNANASGGKAPLTYAWGAVSGATYSNSAVANPVATYAHAGTFAMPLTVTDANGATATGSVSVTIAATQANVTIHADQTTITVGQTVTLSATALDQFGNAYAPASPVYSKVSGVGSVSGSTYTAGSTAGSAVLRLTSTGYTSDVTVTVTSVPDTTAPTASTFATPSAGTTITATLSESGCTVSGPGGWTIAGHTVTAASISGTTLTLSVTPTIYAGADFTIAYTAGTIHDAAGNALGSFSGIVENGSTQTADTVTGGRYWTLNGVYTILGETNAAIESNLGNEPRTLDLDQIIADGVLADANTDFRARRGTMSIATPIPSTYADFEIVRFATNLYLSWLLICHRIDQDTGPGDVTDPGQKFLVTKAAGLESRARVLYAQLFGAVFDPAAGAFVNVPVIRGIPRNRECY